MCVEHRPPSRTEAFINTAEKGDVDTLNTELGLYST